MSTNIGRSVMSADGLDDRAHGTGRLLLGRRGAGLRRTITLNGAAQPVIDADQVTRALIGAGQSCAC